jgi:integrase/recombinase XerD
MKRNPATRAPDFYRFARDYLHTYLPTVARRSPNTVEAYRISLECFLHYLADHEHVDRAHVTFDHFDRQHLKGWLAWMADHQHYAPRTIGLRLTTVKAFLTYCGAEDVTLVALSQAAKALRAPVAARKPIEYLTEAETRAVLAAFTGRTAKSRRNRMLLILLYDTAARVGEITTLTLQDLHMTKPGHVVLTGKGDKTRVVPLTAKTIEHMHVYLAEFHPDTAQLPRTRPVFYSLHNGQPTGLSTDTVAAVLTSAATAAGRTRRSVPDNIHCHMLRKTKAMDLYQQGIPLPIIMRLLGHENMSTTSAFYAFATVDMMRQAVEAATPAIDSPATEQLTEDRLQALYSLQ